MDIQDVMELVRQAKGLVLNRDMADHIKVKGPADYVTQVDTSIQKFLSEKLHELAPDIQFLGEEEGLHAMSGDTSGSGSHRRHHESDPRLPAQHDFPGALQAGRDCDGNHLRPVPGRDVLCGKRKGSFRNGEPIHAAPAESLGDTIIAVGTAPYQKELAHENFQRFERVFLKCQDIRRTGICGHGFGLYSLRAHRGLFRAGASALGLRGGNADCG